MPYFCVVSAASGCNFVHNYDKLVKVRVIDNCKIFKSYVN